ncbi:protein of unknown function [Paraburkholderia kururiensis]
MLDFRAHGGICKNYVVNVTVTSVDHTAATPQWGRDALEAHPHESRRSGVRTEHRAVLRWGLSRRVHDQGGGVHVCWAR